ncbi:MAG: hypothetical protein IGR92_04155 [Leptolyngbyaceae cyanobacterium T60_A2020_046]|nr:hypothetical protein [Leptolyngbyaceae cyanobacterium T60_A2020_046]
MKVKVFPLTVWQCGSGLSPLAVYSYPKKTLLVLPSLIHILQFSGGKTMRVYTNPTLVAAWNYLKLAAALTVLAAILFQANKTLRNEPAFEQLQQLFEDIQGK